MASRERHERFISAPVFWSVENIQASAIAQAMQRESFRLGNQKS
jgi:hypothetical protein